MFVCCILLKNCRGRMGVLNICRDHGERVLIKSGFCPKWNMSKNSCQVLELNWMPVVQE
jgi:hypothetical protein